MRKEIRVQSKLEKYILCVQIGQEMHNLVREKEKKREEKEKA